MNLESVLGQVLRELRVQKGLSQEALALEAGVERNYVSLIELGKNSPTVKMLFKLCNALDIAPSELLTQVENSLSK